jgi:uncharacterized protein (DUF3084 family)
MRMKTDFEGWKTWEGCGRQVAGHRRAAGLLPPACNLFPVLCLFVLLSGCDRKAVEQAQKEAREAKTTVQQLKHSLGLAEKEINNIKAELDAVRLSRDELQQKITQANRERDEALQLVQQAQEAMKARSSGQASATAALQQQITELNARVAEQQKLIDELLKSATVEPGTELPTEPTPVEPNEGL